MAERPSPAERAAILDRAAADLVAGRIGHAEYRRLRAEHGIDYLGAARVLAERRMRRRRKARVTPSGGNVYADLGFPDADIALAKGDVVREIARIAERRGWDAARVAAVLGIDEAAVDGLLRGRLRGYALSELVDYRDRLARQRAAPRPGPRAVDYFQITKVLAARRLRRGLLARLRRLWPFG